LWVRTIPVEVEECKWIIIWKIIYLNCGERYEFMIIPVIHFRNVLSPQFLWSVIYSLQRTKLVPEIRRSRKPAFFNSDTFTIVLIELLKPCQSKSFRKLFFCISGKISLSLSPN